MTGRYSNSGNSRPHIVAPGYQHRPRVPGPIDPMRYGDRPFWRRLFRRAK